MVITKNNYQLVNNKKKQKLICRVLNRAFLAIYLRYENIYAIVVIVDFINDYFKKRNFFVDRI